MSDRSDKAEDGGAQQPSSEVRAAAQALAAGRAPEGDFLPSLLLHINCIYYLDIADMLVVV